MKSRQNRSWRLAGTLAVMAAAQSVFGAGPREMELLDRGVVALVEKPGQVWVSWRLLGTEPADTAFNVYRGKGKDGQTKLNDQPLTKGTWFIDDHADLSGLTDYSVRPVLHGKEQPADGSFRLPANAEAKPYLSIPIETPAGYSPNDASVADLDGDGQYDIILHQEGRAKDNSQVGITDPPILQAYKMDWKTGTSKKLWEINLGKNIRDGAHYTQFMVYDLDGDGKAELVCKTADGTVDGVGKVIGDPNANYVNKDGFIVSGPEYLTVFNGQTGAAMATTKYIPRRHPDTENPTPQQIKDEWGDKNGNGNRIDRFLACVAYLDGVHPSVVMCRGYYTRTVLAAWDWRDGKLTSRWVFDSKTPGNEKYAGQGNHNLSVADVDGDGKDEIIYGSMCVNADGTRRWSTGVGHGDAIHVSDLDPSNPGLEVFKIQERFDDAGQNMVDAKTGKILWKRASLKAATSGGDKGEGPARGMAADIDPRHPGAECWSFGAGINGISDAKGKLITAVTPKSCNFTVLWDGDDLTELLDGTRILKWDWTNEKLDTLLDAKQFGCRSNNGTKATPTLSADLLGDWREEVIWPTTDGRELRLFTTTAPTDRRLPTLMHDPEYRMSIAWQNVGYNQPPHPDYFIGAGMKEPTLPVITTAGAKQLTAAKAVP